MERWFRRFIESSLNIRANKAVQTLHCTYQWFPGYRAFARICKELFGTKVASVKQGNRSRDTRWHTYWRLKRFVLWTRTRSSRCIESEHRIDAFTSARRRSLYMIGDFGKFFCNVLYNSSRELRYSSVIRVDTRAYQRAQSIYDR